MSLTERLEREREHNRQALGLAGMSDTLEVAAPDGMPAMFAADGSPIFPEGYSVSQVPMAPFYRPDGSPSQWAAGQGYQPYDVGLVEGAVGRAAAKTATQVGVCSTDDNPLSGIDSKTYRALGRPMCGYEGLGALRPGAPPGIHTLAQQQLVRATGGQELATRVARRMEEERGGAPAPGANWGGRQASGLVKWGLLAVAGYALWKAWK